MYQSTTVALADLPAVSIIDSKEKKKKKRLSGKAVCRPVIGCGTSRLEATAYDIPSVCNAVVIKTSPTPLLTYPNHDPDSFFLGFVANKKKENFRDK